MITELDGNLLTSECDIICHQVNCQGKMNSGIAKQIKEMFPEVYDEYINYTSTTNTLYLLGKVLIVKSNDRFIANLFGQYRYGYDGNQYTNYEAIKSCIEQVFSFANKNKSISIGFPYKMSSDRGGADWNIIYGFIKEYFEETDIDCRIYKYKGE